MATFTITSTSDAAGDTGIGTMNADGSYSGTLREAINFANQNALTPQTSTTIDVAQGLTGTITLAGDLPLVATSLQLDGGGLTLNGAGKFRGVLISGIAADGVNAAPTTVGLANLTITNVMAQGGAGGGTHAGGGLGAGGAVFVGPAANVTLTNVDVTGATAAGGDAFTNPSTNSGEFSGGGGLGGDGGNNLGGGGGLFGSGGERDAPASTSGAGGGGGITGDGGDGITADGKGMDGAGGAGLAGLGGGGGGGFTSGAPKGGMGAGAGVGSTKTGGAGGFGGGGGAGNNTNGDGGGGKGGFGGGGGYGANGGFGGGGGSSAAGAGGIGGFGGGGGANDLFPGNGAAGGFAGGHGGNGTGGGGGALGGAIFVTAGGTLTIAGAVAEQGGTLTPGHGYFDTADAGSAYDAGIFYEGGTAAAPATLGFGAGDQTFGDAIGDLDGAAGNTTTGNGLGGAGGIVAVSKTGGGTLTLNGVDSYTGGTGIGAGTIVDLGATTAAGTGAITFAGTATQGAELRLEGGAQVINGTFGNTLTNFGANQYLDLRDFAFTGPAFYNTVGLNSLRVLGGPSDTQIETFTLADGAAGYVAMSDGAGGTLLEAVGSTAPLPCFVTGTAIRVVRDGNETDVAVEDLAVGDEAVTVSGRLRRIAWIGHREVACSMLPSPHEAWPVHIRAGAFGGTLPERDLRLSPGHPVLVGSGSNEHLVPIMCLVNGTSIARVPVEYVTYWHVELDQHDILLAEGLPAESYLDWGDRGFFTEAAAHALANPDLVFPGLAGRCRPVAIDGPIVEAERRRLDAVFATRLAAASAWPGVDTTLEFCVSSLGFSGGAIGARAAGKL